MHVCLCPYATGNCLCGFSGKHTWSLQMSSVFFTSLTKHASEHFMYLQRALLPKFTYIPCISAYPMKNILWAWGSTHGVYRLCLLVMLLLLCLDWILYAIESIAAHQFLDMNHTFWVLHGIYSWITYVLIYCVVIKSKLWSKL